jgi:hypothetical protein
MIYDVLTGFAQWWLANRILSPPLDHCYTKAGGSTGFTLFRQAPFQVQVFLNEPNCEIVDHTHPNIDSYEVYLGGEVYFRLNGQTIITPEMMNEPQNLIGKMIRILPSDWHGATLGDKGGAFFSIQHWLNGVAPTSVELDWQGPAIDEAHSAAIGKNHDAPTS